MSSSSEGLPTSPEDDRWATGPAPVINDSSQRRRRGLLALLIMLLLILVALLTIPVSPVTRLGQATNHYSIEVSEASPGSQEISVTFSTLCGETTSQLPLVGNQTFWLDWTGSSNAEVRLASLVDEPAIEYYSVSNQTSGGYAHSSASTFDWLCSFALTLLVNSNATQVIEVQVGLIYDYSVHVPLL